MTWDGATVELTQQGKRHTLYWSIHVAGNVETIRHGILGGKLQSVDTNYDPIFVGQANEETAEAHALNRAQRKIDEQTRDGYRPLGEETLRELDITEPLPSNLCFWKPDNSVGVGLKKKFNAGHAWAVRKRDGMAYVIRTTSTDVEIYSRKMHRTLDKETDKAWEERFPHLYESVLTALIAGDIPTYSILLGELIMDRKGADDFRHIESITKSLTEKSLQTQARSGWPSFYIWDIPYWEGEPWVKTQTRKTRLDMATALGSMGLPHILPPDIWDGERLWQHAFDFLPGVSKKESRYPTLGVVTPHDSYQLTLSEYALHVASSNAWEGWVVVDPEGIDGECGVNLKGTADRSGAICGKSKPSLEDDFIACWDPEKGDGTYGTGKHSHTVGSLALYQFSSAGDFIFRSQVSGGIKDIHTKAYSSGLLRADLENRDLYPLVVQIAFDGETPAPAYSLRFPRIVRFRTDKEIAECVNPNLQKPLPPQGAARGQIRG